MTKEILIQYADLQEELRELRQKIDKTRQRMEKLRREGTVIDSVTGTRADGTFGRIRIEGFPYMEYDKRLAYLNLYITQMREREERLLEQTTAVEQYISSIADSRMRRLIQYRVLDGLSWYEVADRIGGKATSDSCRMYFDRFLEKC